MENMFDEQSDQGSGFDYRALLKEIWRRKWLFFIPFVLCLSMAAIAIKTMTPIYYSSGQIQVRTDFYRSNLLNDPTSNIARRRDMDQEILWEMETLLTSPGFLENIVRELGMEKTLMAQSRVGDGPILEEQEAIRKSSLRLAARLKIEQDGTHLYRIGVIHEDPQRAYDLTRFILDRFLEEYRKARLAPRASTRDFLEEQKEVYLAELKSAEKELNDFLVAVSSSGLMGNPVNAGNVAAAEERLFRARERAAGPDALEMANLQQAALPVLGALPAVETYAKDSVIKGIVLDLTDLGTQIMTQPNGEFSHDLESQMGRLRVQVHNRVEELVTLNHSNLGILDRNRLSQYIYFSLYASVERAINNRISGHVQAYREFLNQQPLQSSRLMELQSRVTNANSLIQTIDQEITQQAMNLEAGMSDVGLQVSIRQQPVLEQFPIEPNKVRLAFMGFVLSVGIGTGLLVLALLLDKSLKTVVDIERNLGYPVLGTLPQMQTATLEPRRRMRILFWVTIVLGILAVGAVGFLVIYPRLSL